MNPAPSTNGTNGRTTAGQFGPGNRFGKGNPRINRLAANHQALLDCLNADEVTASCPQAVRIRNGGRRWLRRALRVSAEPPLWQAAGGCCAAGTGKQRAAAGCSLDWTLKPEKAAELIEQIRSGDTGGNFRFFAGTRVSSSRRTAVRSRTPRRNRGPQRRKVSNIDRGRGAAIPGAN